MLAGHYGVAFALRSRAPGVKLLWLAIAVQAVDIAFFLLAPLGIEKLVPNAARNGPLGMDLVSIPYTHSLVLTLVYAAIVAGVGVLLRHRTAGLVMAAALASHWALDLLVHLHDLPITLAETTKVGFALWTRPALAFALETTLLGAGCWLLRARLPAGPARRWLAWTFGVLVAIHLFYVATPAQPTVLRMAISAQLVYLITAFMAWRIDRWAALPAPPSSRRASG